MKMNLAFTRIVIITIALLSACQDATDFSKVTDLQKNNNDFKDADYSFGTGDQYFRLEHFDLEALSDTIKRCHQRIFTGKSMLKALNDDVDAWLRDSVFIGKSTTMKGTFILDTTNLLLLNDALTYYMEGSIKKSQVVAGKLFHLRNSMHTAHINGKKIYYEIVPANAKWTNEIGEYIVQTTGDYNPRHMSNGLQSRTSSLRYFCDRLLVDWYITIRSGDFFEGQLAIKVSDITYHYTDDFLRQKDK
jgi:hypothetical protein